MVLYMDRGWTAQSAQDVACCGSILRVNDTWCHNIFSEQTVSPQLQKDIIEVEKVQKIIIIIIKGLEPL